MGKPPFGRDWFSGGVDGVGGVLFWVIAGCSVRAALLRIGELSGFNSVLSE